jgi:iron complex outermembrane receptor protein
VAISANYSWLSKTIFDLKIVGVDGTETVSLLHPPNKYRLGFKYIPDSGFRANVSFQHDPSYQVYLGQYTGLTDEKNLIDASVGYKLDNGLIINLSAQNLFDNEYRTFPNFPKIGRRILTKLTYTFGESKE